MKPGDTVTVTVESIAFGGAGVAHVDGCVLFVPFVIPEELVRVRIERVHSRYLEAQLLEILEPSPLRQDPVCKYFGKCGGCSYQHLPYEKQVELKEQQLRDLFRQLWKGESLPSLGKCIPSPKPIGYRSKIRMKYKRKKDRSIMGYFSQTDKRILDIEQCPLAHDQINQWMQDLRGSGFQILEESRKRSYNLEIMQDDQNLKTNLSPPFVFTRTVGTASFVYDRNAFFQINDSIFPELVQHLFQILESFLPRGQGVLYDWYCGVGFFGILLADFFDQLVFVEANKQSFQYLKKNIQNNNLEAKSRAYRCEAGSLPQKDLPPPDCLLVDPPRSGMDRQAIGLMTKTRPALIFYVSCNPATQVRDLNIFQECGYETHTVTPMDFFPQTKHIETLAVLKPSQVTVKEQD